MPSKILSHPEVQETVPKTAPEVLSGLSVGSEDGLRLEVTKKICKDLEVRCVD